MYRFHNILVRDAAYPSLLKRARATLHERFVSGRSRSTASAAARRSSRRSSATTSSRPFATARSWGRSTPRAGRSRARLRKLASRPARLLPRRHAGLRVAAQARAAAVLPTGSPARLGILFDLGEAMIGHGAFDDARELITDGLRIAEQLGDERLVARMTIDELMLDQFTGTGSWTQQIDRAKAIIKVWSATRRLRAVPRVERGHVPRDHPWPIRSRDGLFRHDGRPRPARRQRAPRGAGGTGRRLSDGPRRDPGRGGDPRLRRAARQHPRQPPPEAVVLGTMAQLKAMDSQFDEARAICERVRGILTELQARIDANSTRSRRQLSRSEPVTSNW